MTIKNGEFTVQMLPTITRLDDHVNDADDLARYALICMLGEKIDLTTLQVFWLNRTYYDRGSGVFSYREAFCRLLNTPRGLRRLTVRRAIKRTLDTTNREMTPEEQEKATLELESAGRVLIQDRGRIEALLMGIGEDLPSTNWYELVEGGLMLPITASKFMMLTRPCEHVVLSPLVLQWAQRVPAVLGVHRPKVVDGEQQYADSYPAVAPEDAWEYAKLEYHARRQQRVYFPGRTSLECHLLITESEASYAEKRVVDDSAGAGRAELNPDCSGG